MSQCSWVCILPVKRTLSLSSDQYMRASPMLTVIAPCWGLQGVHSSPMAYSVVASRPGHTSRPVSPVQQSHPISKELTCWKMLFSIFRTRTRVSWVSHSKSELMMMTFGMEIHSRARQRQQMVKGRGDGGVEGPVGCRVG